jgi:hypothetical protein
VKSADVSAGRRAEGKGTLAHFVGGLIGKSDGTNIVRRDTRTNESGDTAGYDAGFAAARPRDDKQGTVAVEYGFLLGWSQPRG